MASTTCLHGREVGEILSVCVHLPASRLGFELQFLHCGFLWYGVCRLGSGSHQGTVNPKLDAPKKGTSPVNVTVIDKNGFDKWFAHFVRWDQQGSTNCLYNVLRCVPTDSGEILAYASFVTRDIWHDLRLVAKIS